jgi:hypothetical protein
MTFLELNNILSPVINLFLCVGVIFSVTVQQKFNKLISQSMINLFNADSAKLVAIEFMEQRISFLEKKLNDKC